MVKLAELLKLSTDEKFDIIEELFASIPDENLEIKASDIEIVRGRAAQLKADPSSGISFEELKRRLG